MHSSNLGVAFVLSGLASAICIPAVRHLAFALGAVDEPGERRVHSSVTPRLGGVAIFIGLVAGLGWLMFSWKGSLFSSGFVRAAIFGAPIALGIGIWDDVVAMGARRKFVAQIGLGILAYLLGFRIEVLSLGAGYEFTIGLWSLPLTVIWISGVMNAVNLIDGLDGLAAGISAVAFSSIGLAAYLLGNVEVAAVCAVSAAATLAFLRYNFSPAKIFMGDSGSMLLGYLLALSSISFGGSRPVPIYVSLLFLAFPIADMAVAIMRRGVRSAFLQRERSIQGWKAMLRPMMREVFSADGDHIHHRLLSRGFSQRRVALTLYAFSALASAFSLLLWYLPAPISWVLFLGSVVGVRHLVLSLEYAEFAPLDIRERMLQAGDEVDQRPALLRRVP